MSDEMKKVFASMLTGFVNDPPDSEYQEGYLAALLTISYEVAGFPYNDPLWQEANCLLSGDDPTVREMAAKKRAPFTVIDGGKS